MIEYLKRPFEWSFWRKCLTLALVYVDQNYFYRLHFLYIVMVGLLGACVISLAERDHRFLDCLYHSYSAITSTGLASIDMSKVSAFTQVVTFVLMQLGSSVLLTLPVVLIKRHYLRKRFARRLEKARVATSSLSDNNNNNNNNKPRRKHKQKDPAKQPLQGTVDITPGDDHDEEEEESIPATRYNSEPDDHIGIGIGMVIHHDHDHHHDYHDGIDVVQHHFNLDEHRRHEHEDHHDDDDDHDNDDEDDDYIDDDQDDSMVGLEHIVDSPTTKESSGGVSTITTSATTGLVHSIETNLEYRSLGKLLYIIPLYQLIVYAIGSTLLYILTSATSVHNVMLKNNVASWWWSIFESVSAFNNCGFVLFTDNLVQLNNRPLILVTISFLIAMGNTLYPVFLRIIISVLKKVSKDPVPYEHLAENPRSLYTHLFPVRQTVILTIVWWVFTISQMSLMAILETNDKAFEGISSSNTFFNYFFQSVSTRTAGFNSVDISLLSSSVLILFVGLMFVSSYPLVISLKGSAVNGKYSQDTELKTKSVMKDILIRDIFIIYVCILLIGIIEEHRLDDAGNPTFTVFHIIFEVISAFGCVGLSMGFPGAVSFSAILKSSSKLVIIVVMLLGKHRALPDSIDTAVVIKEKAVISKLFLRRRKARQYIYLSFSKIQHNHFYYYLSNNQKSNHLFYIHYPIMNPLIIIFILCIVVSSVFANLSCNNQYVFVNDTNSLSSFSLFDHVEQQSNIIQNKNISLSMMMQPSSVSLSSFNHFEHPIILNKNKNNKNNTNYNNNNSNNNNDIDSSISQTQFDSNHIVSQCHLPSNHTFIPIYNNKKNNNNNLSFNSSVSISIPFNVLSQSHFQSPLNHSTNNHIIFYGDKEEEEEEYVQLNSNNNTISCFNHVEHQLISHNIHFNSSHVLFISNHSTTKNHIILEEEEEDFNNSRPISISCFNVNHQSNLILEEEESVQLNSNNNTISFSYFNQSIPIDNNTISFFNDHQSSIPCFKSSDLYTRSTTNNHILVEEEFVQLNKSSINIINSLTCLDNVKHQSIPINNQSNNNNNYFSLIQSSSLISPIPFSSDYFNSSNTSTSSSSSSTLYLLSNTINSTRSNTSPFSRYSSNISRIENNNNAVTSSDNLKHSTDSSSFIFIDTKVANNYFDSLNCFGTNHSNHTTIQQQQPSSSPINHDTILTTIHTHKSTHNQYSQITPPSSNNNNNNKK
ncbi:transmembrane protein [Cavenderia fasciculata]|uniref:Transmembrane protein n=1 Tax=Cavenderia fasciculata TaxID=261658 RepID=F4Q314_CACFS|nr:uncharacterized protein DFA_08574 [Cavenderia fasciculata]EGG17578.1 transmembrane protein [Cavenderia fasciculata]|eukprot:XP_004356062.1 transmembrane protein [Cavenderia fasciculata]